MEKDDEVSGSGNSYSTYYRQYDSRLARWFSTDPLVSSNAYKSPYVVFNNNPLMFIDPRGDTDYFNLKGKKIASDNTSNGEKMLLTSRKVVRAAKKAMKEKHGMEFKPTALQRQDIFPVPNADVMQKLEETFKETEVTGLSEFGFMIGENDGGVLKGSTVYTSGDQSWNPNIGIGELNDQDFNPLASSVHSHPRAIRKKGTGYTYGGYTPSQPVNVVKGAMADTDFAAKTKYADVVLSYRNEITDRDRSNADKANGGRVRTEGATKNTRVISFYPEGNISTRTFDQFKKALSRIESK